MNRQQICEGFIKHMIHFNRDELPLSNKALANLHKTIVTTNKIISRYPAIMKDFLIAKANNEIVKVLKESYNIPVLEGWCIIKEFRKYLNR